MPVILPQDIYDLWLDPRVTNPAAVTGCLKPYEPDLMRTYPVSKRVNRTDNDDPECAEEVPEVATVQTLF